MAFDALQVKALEGLNKFYKYDRPSINYHQHGVGGKEILGKNRNEQI